MQNRSRGTAHSLNADRRTERKAGIPNRTAIEERIARSGDRLSPNRRLLLQSTLENPDETFFLSSRALARRYHVDPATIVRTVQALGYKRYSDFAADLRAHFVSRLTPYRILKATTDQKRTLADHVRRSLDRDLGNLNRLHRGLDPERVVSFARQIHRARRILVVGSDLAASLASLFAYALVPLGFDAESPVGSTGNLQHKVRLLAKKDLLVAISFGRCLRVTVEAAKLARSRGVPTVAITDSDSTPLARHCDRYFVASTASVTFCGSYVAPMALLNSVIMACAEIAPSRALALLRQTEKEYLSGPRWYEAVPADDEDKPSGRIARRRK